MAISINPEINCLVAKAVVRGALLSSEAPERSVNNSIQYQVFYRDKDGVFNNIKNFHYDTKERDEIYEIYWICENNVEIKVPLGVPKTKDTYGINGELLFNVDKDIGVEKLMHLFVLDVSAWQVEGRDGIRYEDLSEYFVNSNGQQSGLSIILRDKIKPAIESVIKNEKIILDEKVDEDTLKKAVKTALDTLKLDTLKVDFASFGLKLVDESIESFTVFESKSTEA